MTDVIRQEVFDRLRALERNWDSYGGKPPTEAALHTLGLLSVVPTAYGGVQVELHTRNDEIEIEVAPSGRVASIVVSRQYDERRPDETAQRFMIDVSVQETEVDGR